MPRIEINNTIAEKLDQFIEECDDKDISSRGEAVGYLFCVLAGKDAQIKHLLTECTRLYKGEYSR